MKDVSSTKIQIERSDSGSGKTQHVPTQKSFNPIIWKLMIGSCVLVYGSYSVIIHLSKKDKQLQYNSSSVILLIELLKLILSITMYTSESDGPPLPVREILSWRFILPFSVPAILYCATNNLGILLQMQMDPATYQVLSNMKILSTAILYRIIMKKVLSWVQWFSLFLLFVAACQNSIGGFVADQKDLSAGVIHITFAGILMISLYCFLSGLAGVYSEYILKDRFEVSIHIQNSLLYVFGIILNGSLWLFTEWKEGRGYDLFEGFNFYVYLLILCQAIIGLLMSAVMKHSSNITRLFIISSAAAVTTLLSMAVFHLQLNLYFCIAFVLLTTALILYHRS